MEQSRLMSVCETLVSTAVGFVVSTLAWRFVVCPVWHIPYSAGQNYGITAFFTVLSLARGYTIRRFFARHMQGLAAGLAGLLAPIVRRLGLFDRRERSTKSNSAPDRSNDLAGAAALLRRRG